MVLLAEGSVLWLCLDIKNFANLVSFTILNHVSQEPFFVVIRAKPIFTQVLNMKLVVCTEELDHVLRI